MAWLEDQQNTNNEQDVWLKFPPLKNVGEKAEIRMRILEKEPAGVWVHWMENKPFNCCRPDHSCPVCEVREAARTKSPDTYRDEYPMRFRYFFNVLVTENGKPVVKVFSFGPGLGKDLKQFSEKYAERYGPLTAYDIAVRKTQVGRLPMNVEYSVFFEGTRSFTVEEGEAADTLHDLTQYTKPASVDALRAVAQGRLPENQEDERVRLIGQIRERIPRDMSLSDFNIDEKNPPETPQLESLLESLR